MVWSRAWEQDAGSQQAPDRGGHLTRIHFRVPVENLVRCVLLIVDNIV